MDCVKDLITKTIANIEGPCGPYVGSPVMKIQKGVPNEWGLIRRIKRVNRYDSDAHADWPYRWIVEMIFGERTHSVAINRLEYVQDYFKFTV